MSHFERSSGSLQMLNSQLHIMAQKLSQLDSSLGLLQRFDSLLGRIAHVEAVLGVGEKESLVARQQSILSRIEGLEKRISSNQSSPAAAVGDESAIQQRLRLELTEKGFSEFKFVRVPADYYDQPLEYRQQCLSAHSIDHLCKSIIMENTKAHPSVEGWENPCNSKYYVIIVQYSARLHADNLAKFVHKLNGGKHGRQYFNMRLAPEDVSDTLSGYEHNAVTPIGIKTPLPIIISHRILSLQPDFFWLGAGEVDLKVGFKASEFVDKYKPFVADCTY